MFTYLHQLWHTKELRKRILITLGILLVYRILANTPVPGTDPVALSQFLGSQGAGGLLGVFASLTGGAVNNFSVAMLGLSPYINASIIIQLCSVIFPKLEALSKEGQQGQQVLNRYTRWLSFPLCFIQSYGFLVLIGRGGANLIDLSFPSVLMPMLFVTAGSIFLMWLGEIISEKGIGNGISMIIFTGIVANIPSRISAMYLGGTGGNSGPLVIFAILAVAMLIAVVLFTDAHRLIPITYANQGAGRGVAGGLPIRLNQAGMIPILFAISLITLPAILAQFLQTAPRFQGFVSAIQTYFNAQNPSYGYVVAYFLLVLVFTFFYVSVTFKPKDLAEQIQKRGGFIPGMRPGKQTADMLAKTSNRLNLWGGVFLGIVAIVPILFTKYTSLGSQNLIVSGSGLIIMVGVVMELIRQVNAQMLAHDYDKLV
ncbi:MAG TPA: preprotein translocase subunit SecY [Candidatus Peribacteraceae bacterium]|nr:preprotein translocase subunit SecY [Candidatus Peribacteraceae bacterium]